MWLCDIEKALAKIREEHGHLGIVVDKIRPLSSGIIFEFSSGHVVRWDMKDNSLTLLYENNSKKGWQTQPFMV